MTAQTDIVKQSDLLNQLVLNRRTMEELGQVEVLWMYPKVHRVLGFITKSGFLGAKKAAFNLDQLHAVGAKSILVNSQPMETDAEKVRQLESLIHCEVWTDNGNKVGKITDYLFNLKTGTIQAYLFACNGWSGMTGSSYKLPPSQILNLGSKRVLVSESVVHSLESYRAGIQEKLSKATELLKEEKTHVAAEFRSLFKQAQTATELAKERAHVLAEQAKEKAQSLNEQLLEKTQNLAQQAAATSQMITDEIIDRTQAIADPSPLEDEGNDDWELEAPPAKPQTSKQPPQSSPLPIQSPNQPIAKDDSDDLWDDEWATAVSPPVSPPQPLPTAPPQSTLSDENDDEPWI